MRRNLVRNTIMKLFILKTVHQAPKLPERLVTYRGTWTKGIGSAELEAKSAHLVPKLSEQLVTYRETWTQGVNSAELEVKTQ